MKKSRGFTLIEVMLVIFIIGLMTVSITFPAGVLAQTELLAVRDRLVMDFRWARMKAIVDNRTYYFRIYSRDMNNDGQCEYQIYWKDKKEEHVIRRGSYPAEFKLYKNINPVPVNKNFYDRIRFTERGTALNGTIGFELKEKELIMITVSQLGRIRSYEK